MDTRFGQYSCKLGALARAALALCFSAVCMPELASAGDVAQAAADGTLWTQSTQEISDGVLKEVRFRIVDGTTVRMRRGAQLQFAGLRTGDVLLQLSEDRSHAQMLNTTVYNKGDDGELSKADFEKLLSDSVEKLTALLQTEPKQHKTSAKETAVRLRAWEWESDHCAALLEASSTGSGKKYVAEFIRLTIAPEKSALERGGADDAAKRSELRGNVQHHDDGSVWIKGIPMVDQGEKGYCVPASLSRVFAYYGMDAVDQHSLAALCKSSENGTTLEAMEKSLRSISAKFHVSVVPMEWLSQKMLMKELPRLAQKKHMSPSDLQPKHLLELLKGKPAVVRKGMKDIKKYVDAGIPVVWAVMLGMFPEQGLPQSMGGHMRLIIGYNEQKQAILYTDSWGAGHEMKAMPVDRACAITQALYVLRPKR